jgi:hypothetical protein
MLARNGQEIASAPTRQPGVKAARRTKQSGPLCHAPRASVREVDLSWRTAGAGTEMTEISPQTLLEQRSREG